MQGRMPRTRALLFSWQCPSVPMLAHCLTKHHSQHKSSCDFPLPEDFLLQITGQNLATYLLLNQSLTREMAWLCQLFKILILGQLLSLLRSKASCSHPTTLATRGEKGGMAFRHLVLPQSFFFFF